MTQRSGRSNGRTPVMDDVARLAGVSRQTVSRVINGQPSLRPETRDRVQEAIRQLGYRPNTAARALVTRRSATIGVVGSRTGFWGPSQVHRTLQAAGREAGYFVSSVNLPGLSRDAVTDAVDHLKSQLVEGIVLIAANDDALDVARTQETAGVPVVVVEGECARARWTVGVDQFAGGVLATGHLLELGHTTIAHVTGPLDWSEARARRAGWRAAIQDAGGRPGPELAGDWSAASGHLAGLEVAQHPEVTAVFAANDQMAVGVLRALQEAGRSIPDDVSVVGFDDIPEAAYLMPPLTTVQQDFAAIGRSAIALLTAAISGTDPDPEPLIAPELVVRRSSGPVPGASDMP